MPGLRSPGIGRELAGKGVRARDDLEDLLRDLRLARPVERKRQPVDQVAGVLRGVPHRRHLRGEEGGRRLEQRAVDLRLAGVAGLLDAGGGQIALAGGTAALFVLFRMLARPGGQTDLVSLSLSWGIWLALLGAAAIVAGGLSGSTQTRRRPAGCYGPQI